MTLIILKDKNIYQSFILLWNVPLGLKKTFLIICSVRLWNVTSMALCYFEDFCGNIHIYFGSCKHLVCFALLS